MRRNARILRVRTQLDDIDRALLRALQRDAGQTLVTLGEAVGLSAPAVQRRVAKLERSGVITGTVAVLDPRRVGLAVTVVTLIQCDRDGRESTGDLKRRLAALPEVVSCYELTGTRDFLAVFVVADMDRYTEVVDAALGGDPNVRRFETHVVLDTVKATQALPV